MLKNEDYKKIKDLADNGNKEAKDFLFNMNDLSVEEVNKCIASFQVKPQDEFTSALNFLINDELEAISGYQNVLKVIPDNDREPYNKAFAFIIKEEEKHSRWLKMIEAGKIEEVLKEQKKE